jgi:altronate dehydratase small subunit
MDATDRRILVLAPEDDVAVACVDLPAGATVTIDGAPVVLERDVPTGHKLARRAIAGGAVVLKYGAPIGRARTAIAPGAYVHTHNLGSDYIPTWDREGREMVEAPES